MEYVLSEKEYKELTVPKGNMNLISRENEKIDIKIEEFENRIADNCVGLLHYSPYETKGHRYSPREIEWTRKGNDLVKVYVEHMSRKELLKLWKESKKIKQNKA